MVLNELLIAGQLLNPDSTALEQPKLQTSNQFGIIAYDLSTGLPSDGMHSQVFFSPLFNYDLGVAQINGEVRTGFHKSDIYPLGTKNEPFFHVNKLNVSSKIKDIEFIIGTFAEQLFGWNEPTFPRNGAYVKFNPKIKGINFTVDAQLHLGQYMDVGGKINNETWSGNLPFYGFGIKGFKKFGNNNSLLLGINYKDFQGQDSFLGNEYTLLSVLGKYTTQLSGNPLDITLMAFKNLDVDDKNIGYLLRADYKMGDYRITMIHPNIGLNSTPIDYTVLRTPQVGFYGAGVEIAKQISDVLDVSLGAFRVFPEQGRFPLFQNQSDRNILKIEGMLNYRF